MKGRKILLVDTDNRNLKFGKRVLSSTHAEVFVTTKLDEALDMLINVDFDLVYADFSCKKILEATSKISPNTRTCVITSHNLMDVITYLETETSLSNFLAKNVTDEKGPFVDANELLMTTEKILSGDIFGIEKYLRWGVEPVSYQLYSSDRRQEYIDEISQYCSKLGCRESLIKVVSGLCDEFMMNAIYDAPRNKEGKTKYAHLNRREQIILEPNENATFRYASDGELLAVSVEDPFGAIEKEKVLSYLAKCFTRAEGQIDQKEGGAGLGLYFIWKSVGQFIINVDPGVRTEFIGLINLGLSMKEFKTMNRSFHFFNTQTNRKTA